MLYLWIKLCAWLGNFVIWQGLREAVKNGDVAAVKDLLSQVFICYKLSSGLFKDWWPVYSSLSLLDGVCNNGCCFQGLDANYFDKQGMSLLHLVRPFLYMSSRIFVTLFPCTEFGVCGFCNADNRVVITCTYVAPLLVSCRQQCSTSQRSHSCWWMLELMCKQKMLKVWKRERQCTLDQT
jgi:hypothetical protein